MNVKIFADGANLEAMLELARNPIIKGFTTNPTLMKAAGVIDYLSFAKDVLVEIQDRPISFEVFADDFNEMQRQAELLAALADNIYVKIPVTNTQGEKADQLIRKLSAMGVKVNVTALMTDEQVEWVASCIENGTAACISVFAGRIADAGVDPMDIMRKSVAIANRYNNIEIIWASPREVLNIVQADSIGCHIITVTPDILKKLPTIGKDLDEFSLDTVKMFYSDASAAGYSL